jgi:hypothetical protein
VNSDLECIFDVLYGPSNPNCKLVGSNEVKIELLKNLKRGYILCVISDHYPALSFQAWQFLKYQTSSVIQAPFVLDIFTLDVMPEMLESPILFFSYIDRRASYQEKIYACHELTILSYHLKRNLWFEKQYNMIQLEDDIVADLDIAMMVRREGAPGPRTPDGILTRLKGTRVGAIVKAIESRPDSATISLGLNLLMLAENAADWSIWVAHSLEHHDHTLVDCFLIQILTPAGREKIDGIRSSELVHVMLLADGQKPRQVG